MTTRATDESVLEARAQNTGGNVSDRSVLLQLEVRTLGNRASVSSDVAETDADKESLTVSKELLDSPELRGVRSSEHRARTWLRNVSLPSLFRGGFYLVPIAQIAALDDELVQEREPEWRAAVEEFVTAYPRLVDEAKERLKVCPEGGDCRRDCTQHLYRASEYPHVDLVRGSFVWTTRIVTLSTPALLQRVRRDIFEREIAKAKADVSEAAAQTRNMLRAQMRLLTGKLAEVLKPGEDGRRKAVRKDFGAKLAEFLELFPFRNDVLCDDDLARYVDRARQLMNGVDPELLKDDETARAGLQRQLEALTADVSGLVEEGGLNRRLRLE